MNQLHLLPEDSSAAADVVTPLLERLDPEIRAAQALIITSDSEAAAGIAARLASTSDRPLRILAATSARRATRVQSANPAHIVVGAPEVLVEIVRAAMLKLDAVSVVVLAWVDDLDGAGTRALETLMAELPKDSARVIIAGSPTPAVEQLVERYARRAQRLPPIAGDAAPAVSLSFVATSDAARLPTLRRLLDAIDPVSAIVIARTPEARASSDLLIRSLGYGGDAPAIRVAETAEGDVPLVILFDLPSTEDEFRRVVRGGGSGRVIAIVAPRQLAALRRLAGGSVTPFALPAAAERARSRAEQIRDELREVLAAGQFAREVLSLEPLLSDFDGIEVAAAALRLLEAERARPKMTPANEQPSMTKLYVNVGEMDGVRPADLVGAITNEAGISRSELGRVDVRERHSTIEVAGGVANAVVDKMTGVSIKGRRALVKIDEGRERPSRPMGPRGDRPRGDRPRGDRPRGDRPRSDRPRRDPQ